MLPLVPIFNTYHGMPLRTVQRVHHHQVEAILFLVKVMLPGEDLLGKFLAVNQARKVYKLTDFGGSAQSILAELTKVLLSHHTLQLLPHLRGPLGYRLAAGISIVHVGEHFLDELLGGDPGGSFPLRHRCLLTLPNQHLFRPF